MPDPHQMTWQKAAACNIHQAEEIQSLVMHSFTGKQTAAISAHKALLGKVTQQPTYLVSKVIDSSCTLV